MSPSQTSLLKIAFVFNSVETGGGGYQQEMSTFQTILKYNTVYEFVPLVKTKALYQQIKKNFPDVVLGKTTDRFLKKHDFDLVFYSYPAEVEHDLNYVVTVWDVGHLDCPEFPETRRFGEHFEREKVYKHYTNAVAILTDSKWARQRMIDYYRFSSERVYSAPFLPSSLVKGSSEFDIKKLYQIKTDYLFYPAQFWPHKNHVYLIQALKVLREKHQKTISVVFTGADYGNLKPLKKLVKTLNLEEQVYFLGFVPADHIKSLYEQSLALVMPIYNMAATNIPPLEAAALEVPVFYSDQPYHRKQMEKGAIYFDLKQPDDLAKKLHQLVTGKINTKKLTAEAKKIVESWTDKDYWQVIDTILKKYLPIKTTWQDSFYQDTAWQRGMRYYRKNGFKQTLRQILGRFF